MKQIAGKITRLALQGSVNVHLSLNKYDPYSFFIKSQDRPVEILKEGQTLKITSPPGLNINSINSSGISINSGSIHVGEGGIYFSGGNVSGDIWINGKQ